MTFWSKHMTTSENGQFSWHKGHWTLVYYGHKNWLIGVVKRFQVQKYKHPLQANWSYISRLSTSIWQTPGQWAFQNLQQVTLNLEIILPEKGLLMNQLSHMVAMSEHMRCKLWCVWTGCFHNKCQKQTPCSVACCMSLAGSNFHQHYYVASKDGNLSYWVVHQQDF